MVISISKKTFFLIFRYISKTMQQRTLIKRYISPLLVLLILCSSIGISSYERFCSCTDQEYHSLFIKNQGDCCKKAPSKAKEQHSCCSKSKASCSLAQAEHPNLEQNCCDTEVKLLALDIDAPLELSVDLELKTLGVMPNFPTIPLLALPKATQAFEYEEWNRVERHRSNAPPPLKASDQIQTTQIMRC